MNIKGCPYDSPFNRPLYSSIRQIKLQFNILTKENEIKKYLATGLLRSTYFIVEPSYEKGELKAFVFYGGGWGHGVGLCQTGTGGRAEAGQNFKDILMHYYSDTEIKDVR